MRGTSANLEYTVLQYDICCLLPGPSLQSGLSSWQSLLSCICPDSASPGTLAPVPWAALTWMLYGSVAVSASLSALLRGPGTPCRATPLKNIASSWSTCIHALRSAEQVSRTCIREAPNIVTEIYRSFHQSLSSNAWIIHQIWPLSLPSTHFPIHYSKLYRLSIWRCREMDVK